MKSKMAKIVGVVTMLCLAVVLIAGIAPAAGKVLRLQTVYPETSHGGEYLKRLAANVDKYTNGQVKIKIFWPNQLVKMKEAYTALSKGMIDMLYAGSIYYAGIVPAARSEFLPLTWSSPQEAVSLYYDQGYLNLLRKANAEKGVWFLGPTFLASMGFMTNFDVTGLDSFKGKKFRGISVDATLIRKMGASPVAMAPTDMYAAMKRGTIDGIIYPFYSLDTYKFYEVVSCVVLPGVHNPVPVDLFMNLKVWKSLSPQNQQAFERATKEICQETATQSQKWDTGAIVFAKKHNIKVVELNKADRQKLMGFAQEDWKATAAKSPELKEATDLILNYVNSKKSK